MDRKCLFKADMNSIFRSESKPDRVRDYLRYGPLSFRSSHNRYIRRSSPDRISHDGASSRRFTFFADMAPVSISLSMKRLIFWSDVLGRGSCCRIKPLILMYSGSWEVTSFNLPFDRLVRSPMPCSLAYSIFGTTIAFIKSTALSLRPLQCDLLYERYTVICFLDILGINFLARTQHNDLFLRPVKRHILLSSIRPRSPV